MSEAAQDAEVLTILRRLEPALARIGQRLERLEARAASNGERLVRIEATLPHLALKEGIARLPRRGELWYLMVAAMFGAFFAALHIWPPIWWVTPHG